MKNTNFIAIDFETATGNRMACQIGIVVVKNGVIVEKYSRLIRPPYNHFDPQTIKIHHILPDHTYECDTFDIVWCDIEKYFKQTIIVAHNAAFDQDVLLKNLEYYQISTDSINDFVCTYNIYGLGLHDLCTEFGINSSGHHDALFDAECCAKFYLNYLNGITPDRYKQEIAKKEEKSNQKHYNLKKHTPISGDVLQKDLTKADPNNPFYDKRTVITGVFDIDRIELAQILKEMGADINTSITKKTDIVLIGKEPGPKKIEKIEELSLEGYEIRMIYKKELCDIFKKYNGSEISSSKQKEDSFDTPDSLINHFNDIISGRKRQ